MEAHPDTAISYRGSRVWPYITLGLLGAGWVAYFLTQWYASRLAEQWGPAPDVCDSLGRASYICHHTLPYCNVIVFLDVVACGSLLVRSQPGWPTILKMIVVMQLVPAVLLHGYFWVITAIFAGVG